MTFLSTKNLHENILSISKDIVKENRLLELALKSEGLEEDSKFFDENNIQFPVNGEIIKQFKEKTQPDIDIQRDIFIISFGSI